MDKLYILNEIRRTAADGKPLGKAQFLAQTGIKESDWIGRYWTKWSHAQIEAGFDPLTLNAAYEENFILRCILELTRKLGKVPTSPEMRIERRANPSFPSHNVVASRWSRTALVGKLSAFRNSNPEYEDLEPIIRTESLKIAAATPDGAEPNVSPSTQTGYVYVIRAQGAYKIGCTRAPYRRAAEIANQSANGAELIHLISTDDPEGIEKYWHGRFAAKRIEAVNKKSGEWFELNAEEVRAFRRRKFM